MAKSQLVFLFSFFLLGCGSSSNDTQVPALEIQLSQEKEFLKDSVLFDNLPDVKADDNPVMFIYKLKE